MSDPVHIRQELTRMLQAAPSAARAAALPLLRAAKAALDAGYTPDARGVPLRGWPCLLTLLAHVAAMQHDEETLLRVTSDLLSIADKMAPPGEVLRQSAEILVHSLHADMYVCRLRTSQGFWQLHSVARADGGALPLLTPIIDEDMLKHPVMHAIHHGGVRYVVSNDLRGIEIGGESLDCMVYRSGYRSRLAFVLRERMNNKNPFGLVMLYTQREHGFDMYDARFLGKCARIVALTVGRRVAVARDTLEKAAGAMAHYGNNSLNVLRHQAEYCGELVEDMDENCSRALRLTRRLAEALPEDSPLRDAAKDIERALERFALTELAGHLGGVLEEGRRMARIINALKRSATRPRLMRYALGRDVLELEDVGREESAQETP